ncbi:hypothetical protein CKF54_00835 [Psittacicella hinzii]|uniref:Tip attachment protein J domain-containing protein n=1 Tax=Psittacicella hinzii TaxID=2028575 RepID=A0A3A1YAV8_9GAMM|nr:phage tail protein [Psittacicella hinzii]RIY34318.1 hypothetical protein CKF54_00835 [Psittacicella hinzii]
MSEVQNDDLFQKLNERELAFKSLHLSPYKIKVSKEPPYKELYKIAVQYIEQVDDILRFSEPDALDFFKERFSFTYYSEYGKAFINVTQYLINVLVREAQEAFDKREDVQELLAKLQSYSESEGAYFSQFYGWALALNNLNFNSHVLDYYRASYLNGSHEKQNEILLDIKSYITLTQSISRSGKRVLNEILSQNSQIAKLVRSFKANIPSGVEKVEQRVVPDTSKGSKLVARLFKRSVTPKIDYPTNTLVQQENVIDVLSIGPIGGLVDGHRSIYIDDTPILNAKGIKMLPNVQSELVHGWATQSIPYLNNYPSVTKKVDKSVHQDTPAVVTVNYPNASYVEVVLLIPQLIDAEVKAKIEVTNAQGEKYTLFKDTITGKWTNDKEFSFKYYVTSDEEYPLTITVYRENEEIEDDTNRSNPLKFSRVQAVREYTPSYPSLAYVTSVWDNKSYTKEPTRKFHIYGRLVKIPTNYNPYSRQYTGEWDGKFKIDWTNNPAWIIYDLLTDLYIGLGAQIPIDKVDKWSFYNCAQYCDELVDGTPRWTFNGVITKTAKAFNIINQIAGECRANIVDSDTGIKMLIERPQSHVYMFANSNVINGKFTYQGSALRTRNKRVEVKYSDPDNDYNTSSVFVNDSKNASDYRASKSVTLTGCTSKEQAIRYGKFILAVEKFETNTVSFTGNYDSIMVEVGDVVAISDYIVSGMYANGRFKAITTNGTTANLYFDILDDKLKKEKKIYLQVSSGKDLLTYDLHDLQKDDKGYYVTIDITEAPPPKVYDTYTVYTTNFTPSYYRIISKSISPDHTITYQAQKYSNVKFDVVDGKVDIGFTTESNNYGLQMQVSNLSSAKANLSLSNGQVKLTITWSDQSRGDGTNYRVLVSNKKTQSALFSGITDTNKIIFVCDQSLPVTDTEILIYPVINDTINQSGYLKFDYKINIPSLVPSKPKINNLSIVTKKSTRSNINISTSVNFTDVINEKNIENVKLMFSSDPKNLRTNASELLTESNNKIVVIDVSKSNSARINATFSANEIEILKLQSSLLSKDIDGVSYYYRPLYCKVVPVNRAINQLLPKNYKNDDWGIIDCSFYAKVDTQYAQLYVHNSVRGNNKLEINTPSNDQVVNVPLFANIRVKLNDVTIKTDKSIFSTKSSSITFKYDLFDVLRLRESKSYKVEYSSLIGKEYELVEEVDFNISGNAPEAKVDINGTSAQIMLVNDNEAKPDWIILDKTSTNWRFLKYTILWNNQEVRTQVQTPIFSVSELSKKKYAYEFRCFNVYDFQYFKKGSVSIKSNNTTQVNIPNYVIDISRLTVPGNSGRPYHRENNTKIRTVAFSPATYRAIFTGDRVKTYRIKSVNNRSWRDPDNFAMAGDYKSVVSFKSLDKSEQDLIKNSDELLLRGVTIGGVNVEKVITTKSTSGYYLDKDNLALGLKYGAKEDLNSLIYDLTAIEVIRNSTTVEEKTQGLSIVTNSKGEGTLVVSSTEMVNILRTEITNTNPSNAQAYVRYDDDVSSNKRTFKATTVDLENKPISARVNFTVYYTN